eukprot:SRR837773.4888.p1 GENE.SRR837773.4888~~SRR837773.4888.p1  ORF type:complete len:293 (-),score=81.13 SRR837773.4888:108-959(-)
MGAAASGSTPGCLPCAALARRGASAVRPGSLKVYGVPLSQPFRSVIWPLLIKRVPFEVVVTVPGSAGRRGSRSEEFLNKNPLGTVPILEDDGFVVLESPAILCYLADKLGWHDFYPTDLVARTSIASYMHWHHTGTRCCTALIHPKFRPDKASTGEELRQKKTKAHNALLQLADTWLDGTPFLAGREEPSLADFLAYEEVSQIMPRYTNLLEVELHPRVKDWVKRMSQLPYHDEAHAALAEIGDLRAASKEPMDKRMAAATKVGLKAISTLQGVTTQSSVSNS